MCNKRYKQKSNKHWSQCNALPIFQAKSLYTNWLPEDPSLNSGQNCAKTCSYTTCSNITHWESVQCSDTDAYALCQQGLFLSTKLEYEIDSPVKKRVTRLAELLTKTSKIYSVDFVGCLENRHILRKNCCGYFLGNFLFQHLVPLIQVDPIEAFWDFRVKFKRSKFTPW